MNTPSHRSFPAVLAVVLAACGWALTTAAQDVIYKWVDENGEVHYGQSLPPGYKDLAHEKLNQSGTVIGRTGRALTAAEREALAAQEVVARQAETERENQEKKDRLLLAAYRSEQDIMNAMNGELNVLNEQYTLVTNSIQEQRKSLRELAAQAAVLERAGQPVPEHLVAPLAALRSVIVRLRGQLARLEEQIAFSRATYENDLNRYRSLVAEAAAQDG